MLAVHVAASVGWLGAIAAYIALNVPVIAGADEQLVRAAHLMMRPVAWYAVVPLALTSLVTGDRAVPRNAVGAVGRLAVLLVPLVLNLYKPRGLTRYGWRKQQEKGATGR